MSQESIQFENGKRTLAVEDGDNIGISIIHMLQGADYKSLSYQISHGEAKQLNEFLTKILENK